jgi:glycosyltransferase involved in cell wall biosynthesis
MIGVLVLGSKEYPFGTNRGDDPIPSGGMETYVNDLAPELSKLCRLLIVTRRFKGTKKSERSGKNISVHRVPWIKGKWLRNPSFNIFSFLASLKMMRNVDIVYSNGIVSGFFDLLLARLFRKKAVYRPAGIGFVQYGFPLRQMLFALERLVFTKSDAVVFHSDGEKRNAETKFNLRLDHGHVILTGFPIEKFKSGKKRLSREFGIKNETVITSIARFVPVKGLEHLLKACSIIGSDYGDFKVLLVGSGPEEEKLKRLAGELGISDKVVFAGFRHDVPDILAITDIFALSSLSEGLPTSLLEAMAAEKACVVTDTGLPVDHMVTGLVVKTENPAALKNAIEFLMKNKSLRAKLGKNARKFVEKNCTPKMAAGKHMRLFKRVLGGKV